MSTSTSSSPICSKCTRPESGCLPSTPHPSPQLQIKFQAALAQAPFRVVTVLSMRAHSPTNSPKATRHTKTLIPSVLFILPAIQTLGPSRSWQLLLRAKLRLEEALSRPQVRSHGLTRTRATTAATHLALLALLILSVAPRQCILPLALLL